MLRDFSRFVLALWREWRSLLTGGTVIATLYIWNSVSVKPLPQSINWLVVGLTFIMAAFMAWRKEWMSAGSGFVDIDLAELEKELHGKTGVHQRSIERPLLGKYIRVTGNIDNVSFHAYMAFVRLKTNGTEVSLEYGWRGNARSFIPLPKGTTVTVTGRIGRVSPGVRLNNCSLISVGSMLQSVPPLIKPDS